MAPQVLATILAGPFGVCLTEFVNSRFELEHWRDDCVAAPDECAIEIDRKWRTEAENIEAENYDNAIAFKK